MRLQKLKEEIEKLAKRINAPEEFLPTYNVSEDFARPHLEIHGEELHWVIIERGQELQRRKTFNLEELLFWVFDGITFEMATELEISNRRKEEDSRVQLFEIQETLMGEINPRYSKILHNKHQKLLSR